MKKVIYKSLAAIVVYLLIVSLSHFDPIKDIFDDFAYDKLVTNFLNSSGNELHQLAQEKIPKVNMFLIEDDYLNYYNLKNYGYIFPRKEMVNILESLNYMLDELINGPKAIFIDYDFHYTELPYGRELSKEDLKLINTLLDLSKKTNVLIPKAKRFHFIEDYLIKNNINSNILFVSPNFLLADDLRARRFQSYYKINETIYPNVDLVLYLLSTNRCRSLEELKNIKEVGDEINICGMIVKNMDITQNRFIPKFFIKYEDNPYNYGFTLWDQNSSSQKIKSVSTLVEESVVSSSLEDSIIMIGGDFKGNHDNITIAYNFTPDPIKIPGIVLHLSTLNSFYYFNGVLKNLNPLLGSLIVFLVFFIFSYVEFKQEKVTQVNILVKIFFSTIIMTIVFFIISLILLLYFKLWFNWFAPMFTYQILDFFDKSKEYSKKMCKYIDSLVLFKRNRT